MKYSGKVLRGGETVSLSEAVFNSPVVTLGFFDGVHLGHQALFGEVASLAREREVEAIAVTFDKHPKEVLTGEAPLFITSTGERERLIGELGLTVVELEFTKELSQISAEDFVKDFFVGMLQASAVVLGHETRFGYRGAGNPELLHSLGETLGFETKIVDFKKEGDEMISSSLIREKISAGDLEAAQRLLGRPVTLTGTVVRGKGRGKELGFPTANIDTSGLVLPPDGVYAGRLIWEAGEAPAAVSIGTAPTFGAGERVVEAYAIGTNPSLYAKEVRLALVKKIRDQVAFPDTTSLTKAIERDVEVILRLLEE